MFSFAHPALLWGLALVGVPVLIHLINMFRHRRVEWAAMEFLLASQRKNRTRVVLRQLLLLLMRMATIAAGYGYITAEDDPREWDADVIATTTEELTQIVLKAVNLEA